MKTSDKLKELEKQVVNLKIEMRHLRLRLNTSRAGEVDTSRKLVLLQTKDGFKKLERMQIREGCQFIVMPMRGQRVTFKRKPCDRRPKVFIFEEIDE